MLAFGEYVLRKNEIPPLPSTYEIADKYFFFQTYGLPLLYLEGYYWPRKRTYRSLTNVVLQRTLSEIYLGSSTVRCILINIILTFF